MNEHLKLHKALSEAEVEYQQKFDAVKEFELGLISNTITNVMETLQKWEKLKAEEQVAHKKRDVARKAYMEYLKRAEVKT